MSEKSEETQLGRPRINPKVRRENLSRRVEPNTLKRLARLKEKLDLSEGQIVDLAVKLYYRKHYAGANRQ